MADDRFLGMEEILRLPDGSPRPRDEALALVGHRAVWVAELGEALRRRTAAAPPLSVPRRIFLSYRWGSAEDDAWVERLAEDLSARGNEVTLDRWLQKGDRPPTVPELVAGIADCHVFLAVLDPGYVERLGRADDSTIQDGWVFDEYQVATGLTYARRLRMVGLLRSGDDLPRGFAMFGPQGAGNTFDVRNLEQLPRVLDHLFPPTGPAPAPEAAARHQELLNESYAALAAGRADEAYGLAAQVAGAAPDLMDGHAQMARVAHLSDRAQDGLWDAARALEIDPHSVELLEIGADCAYHSGDRLLAARLAARVVPGTRSPTAHLVLGNSLDELGQPFAGAAHMEIAAALAPGVPSVHNDAGMAYRRAGQPRKALACFERGLAVDPTDQHLLVNQAAAAVEAGDGPMGRRAIELLNRAYPRHPVVPQLSEILRTWESSGGPPPTLMERVPTREPVGVVRCSNCTAEIPFVAPDEGLCATCGAEVFEAFRPCQVCGSESVVLPGLEPEGSWGCPYCRTGTLAFQAGGVLPG